MKTKIKSLIKYFSLLITLSCIVFGLVAGNKYSNTISVNRKLSKLKTTVKQNTSRDIKLTSEDIEIIEETRNLEEWMFNLHIITDDFEQEQYLEEWMFDSFFWKVEEGISNDKVVEKDKNMDVFQKPCMCIDIFSDFEEKEWMKKHSFMIL